MSTSAPRLLIGATGSASVSGLPAHLTALRRDLGATLTVVMTRSARLFLPFQRRTGGRFVAVRRARRRPRAFRRRRRRRAEHLGACPTARRLGRPGPLGRRRRPGRRRVRRTWAAPSADVDYGWLDLPAGEAYERALAIEARHDEPGAPRFAYDFRPHSHYWQAMAQVRSSDHDSGVIEVAGAKILMAMTSIGDGFFPVHLDVDAGGHPAALRIDITTGP